MSWELPTSVTLPSSSYQINSDYRDILEIIAQLQNADSSEYERIYIALALFYEDFDAIPEDELEAAAHEMMRFINCGEDESDDPAPPKQIDWEQDQLMIVADINKSAGCEIRALLFLHWWSFIAFFNGIGDGQLATVVAIRAKRRKGQKLEKWEQEFYQQNKSKVDFKQRYTAEEQAEVDYLNQLLGD